MNLAGFVDARKKSGSRVSILEAILVTDPIEQAVGDRPFSRSNVSQPAAINLGRFGKCNGTGKERFLALIAQAEQVVKCPSAADGIPSQKNVPQVAQGYSACWLCSSDVEGRLAVTVTRTSDCPASAFSSCPPSKSAHPCEEPLEFVFS